VPPTRISYRGSQPAPKSRGIGPLAPAVHLRPHVERVRYDGASAAEDGNCAIILSSKQQ
jgi:hypothetical protein